MSKALLGHRMTTDDVLRVEAARLRQRVADLNALVERLSRENDDLRAEILLSGVGPAAVATSGAPTIRG